MPEEIKHVKPTLTPQAPSTPTTPGDPPPPPAVFPVGGSPLFGGVPVIHTINSVPQTQQPSMPPGYTWR